jgi:hypothetical protein
MIAPASGCDGWRNSSRVNCRGTSTANAAARNSPAVAGQRRAMTQLMVVPIRDKGDAVVIVSLHDGEPLIGYVAKATLKDYFQRDLTNCHGLLLVRSNLQLFEMLLAAKSKRMGRAEGAMPCVEITLTDVLNSRCFLSGESVQSAPATAS